MVSTQYMNPSRSSLSLFLAAILLLSGCAGIRETSCEQFKELRQEIDYTTQYRLLESDTVARRFKPLPKGAVAVVRQYKMDVNTPEIKPCNHLKIQKEIYLLRKNDKNLVLEEIREFYTDDGILIATKSEFVGDQMLTSGYYAGSTPLPIPEKAPPGKYRIVSKLVMKRKNTTRVTVLARASASFKVIARN
ncbi:MAG: hypothetical protein OEM48_02995 [Gammaproteobacteria bacterium]|nr:hypothetical protein [Gammaproteobacteria bacterium]MDH3369974.1 hypothetical protein [Gammaproteobacteria bacterium]MDH3405887.1 hypothetical protein [Gammaproteobacteria bacterium]MDH5486390.1 hypothetical protein [Gammaproteobacteria bacterium]